LKLQFSLAIRPCFRAVVNVNQKRGPTMNQHTTSSNSNEDHLPWLDGLRGLAALWVLISHVRILSGMKYVPVLSWGGLAVDLFMILSGFLMAHHYIQRRKAEPWEQSRTVFVFWTRRFFRIAPLYYVLLILSLLLGPMLGEYRAAIAAVWPDTATPASRYLDHGMVNVISHLSFAFGFLPDFAFRTPLPDWSIGLEMQFYLVFPAIMLAIARIGPVKTTLLFIAACIALKVLFPAFFHQFEMPSFLPMKLSVFFGGIWIALARAHTSMRPGLFIAVALAIVWVTIERSPGAVAQVFLIAPPPGKSRHLACILCEFERAIRPPAA
jgi:peptidoglycan/LPS O-acetylase OafA/YrhL